MNKNEAEKLAYATYHWLEFQITCGRQMLLSESYLSQPVGEFLSHIHNGNVEAEWAHPNFQNQGIKGRPKQVDYGLFSSTKNRPISAIETKWIGHKKTQKQKIVDDIIRLDCIRDNDPQGLVRYFLIAGLHTNITNNLTSLKIQSSGKRTNFLSSILPDEVGKDTLYSVVNCNDSMKKFFKSFAADYSMDLPKTYKAEKIADVHRQNSNTRVIMWKISSSNKRQTFNPKTHWN